MKVALVHKRFAPVGGTEGYVFDLARRLAEGGHEVHAICAQAVAPPHPRIRVRRVPVLPLGRTLRMLSYARGADRLVREESFDLVHGFGKTFRHDLYRLGGGCHATYLEWAHAAGKPRGWRALARNAPHQRAILAVERATFSPGNYLCLVTNSRFVRDDLVRRYAVDPERVRVLYSGVDLERFHPRARETQGRATRHSLGVSPDDLLLVFVGSGFVRKGLAPLLRAHALLASRGLRATLAIVGKDRRSRAYGSLAARLGIEGAVRFLGAIPDPERILVAGDLFVLPTLYDPFANATLEALACGLPAVTTDRNGAAEILEAGRDGAVVPAPPQPEALVEAICGLVHDGGLPRRRSAARETAERYPREAHHRELLALYDEILSEKRCAPAAALSRSPA
jgi:UDP-glucose:(heptosyl)LPS alpha-1,3-glucosyltransferase